MLMTTVQIPGPATNEPQMVIHTAMSNTYISIERVFQNIFQSQHIYMNLLTMENT